MAAQFACNLGSLNLYEFVENPFTKDASFNWGDFESSVRIGVRALDTIIDENAERLPDELHNYKENSLNYRNIGLGVFGYADMLMALGLTYGSKEAIEFSKKLFQDMFIVAVYASANLAKERGAFPKHMVSVLNSEIFRKHFNRSYDFHNNQNFVRYGLRNCSLLSIAPTGTISSLLGRSGGLEPQFSLSYTRRTDNLKESYKIDAAVVKDFMRITGKEELPEYFVTSQEVHWSDRIDTQAAIQESIDTAISSTINLPKETTEDDIELLYLYAWERGLKGVTVFRDGCKKLGILLHNNDDGEGEEEEPKNILKLKRGEIKPISNDLVGLKRTLVTGCGTLHCQAFFDPNTADLQEIYLSKGSTGGCNNFMIGLSRMISLAARCGASLDSIIDQLNSCGACASYATRAAVKKDTSKGSCCPIAVGFALREMHDEFVKYYLENGLEVKEESCPKKEKIVKKIIDEVKDHGVKCPTCGETLLFEGGCNICKSCGWSRCE